MIRESMIPVIVTAIVQETPHVKRFTLTRVAGGSLPIFSAGSHITTYIQTGSALLDRNYSLVNSPDEIEHYQIAIRLNEASRGGSDYWHTQVKVGDQLQISYPKNHFQLSFRAQHHVFYAAGIGITPFMPMMADLKQKGKSFELHYAAKSVSSCAFYDHIVREYGKEARFYFSQGQEPNRLSPNNLLDHVIGTHVYFCGPEPMISEFTEAARTYGYPKSSIHFERFTPPKAIDSRSFQAELRSGKIVHVAKEQTLLDALHLSGVKVPYSCRVGGCGTCEVKVIEGEVDHYDSFLTEEQIQSQKVMLSCVSRARSDKLVLDL